MNSFFFSCPASASLFLTRTPLITTLNRIFLSPELPSPSPFLTLFFFFLSFSDWTEHHQHRSRSSPSPLLLCCFCWSLAVASWSSPLSLLLFLSASSSSATTVFFWPSSVPIVTVSRSSCSGCRCPVTSVCSCWSSIFLALLELHSEAALHLLGHLQKPFLPWSSS